MEVLCFQLRALPFVLLFLALGLIFDSMAKIRVRLRKSLIGRLESHKSCVRGLGLRKIRSSVLIDDTPENMGMVEKVRYLLDIEPQHGG